MDIAEIESANTDFEYLLDTENEEVRSLYASMQRDTLLFHNFTCDSEYIHEAYNKLVDFNLTDYQLIAISDFIKNLDELSTLIQPKKLTFSVSSTEEGEIVFHRKSSTGVTDLIINTEEGFALSYVGFDGENSLIFFEDESMFSDQGFALTFLSK